MKTCEDCGRDVDDLVTTCPDCGGIDIYTATAPPILHRSSAPGLRISVGDDSRIVPAGQDIMLGRDSGLIMSQQFGVYSNVSGFHATICRTGDRLTVVDTSLNGTSHAGIDLEPGRPCNFELPVTLRFGANCFVHFALASLENVGPPESAPSL